MRRHLVVMAREPRLGTVKRRLAADIGALAAWRFYRTEAGRLLRRLSSDRRWLTWLAVTPDFPIHPGRLWPFSGRIVGQGGGDLGQRMGRLLVCLPPGPVVIVGSDIPAIDAHHVAAAFDARDRLIAERRGKLAELRAAGQAYPNDFRKDTTSGELFERFG